MAIPKSFLTSEMIEEKDINEMILSGKHPSVVEHIIDKNTYQGLTATMMMNQWEKTV